MMYLGIFLVTCLSFGLIQSHPGHIRLDDEVRKCKNCLGMGEDAEAKCLEAVEVKPCLENQPVCAQITSDVVFQLLCTSQNEFNDLEASCKYDNSCVAVKLDSTTEDSQGSGVSSGLQWL